MLYEPSMNFLCDSRCVWRQIAGSVICGVVTWGVQSQSELHDAVPPSGVNPLLAAGIFMLILSFFGFAGTLFDKKVRRSHGSLRRAWSDQNRPGFAPPGPAASRPQPRSCAVSCELLS